jgi:hypothetical protein
MYNYYTRCGFIFHFGSILYLVVNLCIECLVAFSRMAI